MTETRIIGAGPWNESLFGCCSDLATCCYGCCCISCLFGDNVSHTSKDATCLGGCCGYCLLQGGCCCLVHKPARKRFREVYGLEEGSGLAGDTCSTWFCSACGVCQEAREIKSRGGTAPMVTTVKPGGVQTSTFGTQGATTGALTSQPR